MGSNKTPGQRQSGLTTISTRATTTMSVPIAVTTSTTLNASVITTETFVNATLLPPLPTAATSSLTFIIVPLGVIALLIALSGLVFLLLRKRRLDHLRHHLMPLYNFDPAEEGEDWESELLEEGTDHRGLRKNGHSQPKLSFSRDSDPY